MQSTITLAAARAARYVASLRLEMRPEARRIALEHMARHENLGTTDALAILRELDRTEA